MTCVKHAGGRRVQRRDLIRERIDDVRDWLARFDPSPHFRAKHEHAAHGRHDRFGTRERSGGEQQRGQRGGFSVDDAAMAQIVEDRLSVLFSELI